MGGCRLGTSGSLFLERQESELWGNFSFLVNDSASVFGESPPMSMAFRVMVIYQKPGSQKILQLFEKCVRM